jgi:preprotein translocase subunit SecG
MEKLFLIVHSLSALAVIVLIMIQQGKGAAAGASFGSGASQTVFGSDGGSSFFTRATAIFATIFFLTSLGLGVIAKKHSALPAAVITAPAAASAPVSDIPVADKAAVPAASDVPATEQGK